MSGGLPHLFQQILTFKNGSRRCNQQRENTIRRVCQFFAFRCLSAWNSEFTTFRIVDNCMGNQIFHYLFLGR